MHLEEGRVTGLHVHALEHLLELQCQVFQRLLLFLPLARVEEYVELGILDEAAGPGGLAVDCGVVVLGVYLSLDSQPPNIIRE